MTKLIRAAFFLCAALSVPSSAQPLTNEARWGQAGPGTMAALERHHQMMRGVPAPYGSMRDRTGYSREKLARGAVLFRDHCESCHGGQGRGAGPRAAALYPRPANLSWLAQVPARQAEPYMYWSIAEGGGQFGSDMPAFKMQLARNDIWALIAFVRNGARGP